MANEGNLKPQSKRTKKEQREIAKKGGIASGKARREKKMFKETLEALLNMPMKSGSDVSVDDIQNFAAIKGKNISVQEAILIAQIQKAMKGDTKAAVYLRDTVGQKPLDKVQLETDFEMTDKLKEVEAYIKGRGSE